MNKQEVTVKCVRTSRPCLNMTWILSVRQQQLCEQLHPSCSFIPLCEQYVEKYLVRPSAWEDGSQWPKVPISMVHVRVRSSPFLQNYLTKLASRFLFVTFAVGHWRLSRSGELCELVSSMNVTSCSPTRRYLGMHVEVTRMPALIPRTSS